MTSTPVVLLLKRSGQSSDRPSGTVVQNGELAIAVGAADPGLYFEDSAGAIRKIGPSHYGTTAPNSSPVGLAGNSVGELWSDSSTAEYYLKVWTGSAWQKIGAAFADSASFATAATTAGSAVLASGAIQASGCILASGAIQASGCILASGALLASGAIIASGTVKSSDIGLSGLPAPTTYGSGALFYQIQSSGIYPAGLYINVSSSWLAV
jgi:hypothetical protein